MKDREDCRHQLDWRQEVAPLEKTTRIRTKIWCSSCGLTAEVEAMEERAPDRYQMSPELFQEWLASLGVDDR